MYSMLFKTKSSSRVEPEEDLSELGAVEKAVVEGLGREYIDVRILARVIDKGPHAV